MSLAKRGSARIDRCLILGLGIDSKASQMIVVVEMSAERAVPILPADDLAVAKRFYVDALGFDVEFESTLDGKTGLLGVRRGSLYLIIDSPMPGHGREACVALHVNDADRYYDEWSKRVAVLRPPHDEAWGARTFDLLDPFGNTLFVLGPPTRGDSDS